MKARVNGLGHLVQLRRITVPQGNELTPLNGKTTASANTDIQIQQLQIPYTKNTAGPDASGVADLMTALCHRRRRAASMVTASAPSVTVAGSGTVGAALPSWLSSASKLRVGSLGCPVSEYR